MPRGVHKEKRPSGCQQRNAKEKRIKIASQLANSMRQFVKKTEDNQFHPNEPSSSIIVPDSLNSSEDAGKKENASEMEVGSQSETEPATEENATQNRKNDGGTVSADGETFSGDNSETPADGNEVAVMEHDGTDGTDTDILKVFRDVSHWKLPLSDHLRTEIVRKGSAPFQNKDGPFIGISRYHDSKQKEVTRQLSKDWFYKKMPDDDKILRSWMVYSPESGQLYCFCCRLFARKISESSSKFITGFQNWWKLNPKVQNHEISEDHLFCLEKWKTLAMGSRLQKSIDVEMVSFLEREKKKWRDILHRLLDITMYLAKQNLAFRGHAENKASMNKGNFLEMVELLAKYDPVLEEHVMRWKNNAAKVSYLSPSTQNELIDVLGKHVKSKLILEIKAAKYYGIMFDSTPDSAHIDQMSEVIRYVKIADGTFEVKEVFLGFFILLGKKAIDLCKEIFSKLEADDLDIMMCRSQGYDNAATMAGKHGGVQAIVKEVNKKAIFNGCVDHSLNLCGQHSFAENTSCVKFFGTLEAVYAFFAASTHRWEIMVQNTGVSAKRLSTTRWSAHHFAVKPVKEQFDEFVSALEALSAPEENLQTRGDAENLLSAILDFTFCCYLTFWSDVLKEVEVAQKYLQTKSLTIDKVDIQLKSLKTFLIEERSNLVDRAVNEALSKAEEYGFPTERRVQYRRVMPGERARDAGLSLIEENRRDMFQCLDRFLSEISHRSSGISNILEIFTVIQPSSLLTADTEELKISVPKLTSVYDEVSEADLIAEIPRLRRHMQAANINFKDAEKWLVTDFLSFILKFDFHESLSSLVLALRLFLTVCVSVATCERSFSKLKLIKNYLRSTMGESRLSNLAISSIENEFARSINFDEVINDFAALKTRKVHL